MSRVIKVLKRLYPDKDWRCERDGFGWRYVEPGGWYADWRSCLVSTSPDDMDGHAINRLYIHKPGEQSELVPQLTSSVYSI